MYAAHAQLMVGYLGIHQQYHDIALRWDEGDRFIMDEVINTSVKGTQLISCS